MTCVLSLRKRPLIGVRRVHSSAREFLDTFEVTVRRLAQLAERDYMVSEHEPEDSSHFSGGCWSCRVDISQMWVGDFDSAVSELGRIRRCRDSAPAGSRKSVRTAAKVLSN
jgi:hypothetical protein